MPGGEFTSVIIALLIGLMAGILGAILGLGGGIIILPAVQILLHYNPLLMVGTTMMAIVFTSASGAWGHFRQDHVLVREGLMVGTGGLLGIALGSFIFKQYLTSDTDIIFTLLGMLFLIMTFKMGQEAWREFHAPPDEAVVSGKAALSGRAQRVGLFILGTVTGVLSGVLGIGGGFLLVPGMIWIAGISPHRAVGTTLLAMLPIALVGTVIKAVQGFVDIPGGLMLGVGAAVGAQLGVYLSRFIPSRIMKLLFALFFFLLAIQYLL